MKFPLSLLEPVTRPTLRSFLQYSCIIPAIVLLLVEFQNFFLNIFCHVSGFDTVDLEPFDALSSCSHVRFTALLNQESVSSELL